MFLYIVDPLLTTNTSLNSYEKRLVLYVCGEDRATRTLRAKYLSITRINMHIHIVCIKIILFFDVLGI